jgi:solute:Na+ symporter, SSS family
MLMAFYLFVACVLVQVVVSLARPKRPEEDPQRLYWASPLDPLRAPGWPGLANYKVLAAVTALCLGSLYYIFA